MDQLAARSNTLGPSPQPSESTPILLRQPVDIIIYIASKLDPVSAASLAITCKAVYAVLAPAGFVRLDPTDKQYFLQLMELDPKLGDHKYYCHLCNTLHSFAQWWGPAMMQYEHWDCPPHTQEKAKHCMQRFKPRGSRLSVGYHHARLVMNRHFYGSTCGLPLENFTYRPRPEFRGKSLIVVQTMTARIKFGLLLLKCTHKLTPVNETTSPKAFLSGVDKYHLKVCHHVSIDQNWYPQGRIPQIKERGRTGMLVPCRDAESCCQRCLTDFETTIEEDERTGDGSSIIVISYHLLGSCREPRDRTYQGKYHGIFDTTWHRRNMQTYPGGYVRHLWHPTR